MIRCFSIGQTVQYGDPRCLILRGTALLIMSSPGPLGENKGSAQRTLWHFPYRSQKALSSPVGCKSSNGDPRVWGTNRRRWASVTALSGMCFPQLCCACWCSPEHPFKRSNSFVRSLWVTHGICVVPSFPLCNPDVPLSPWLNGLRTACL